MQIPCRIHEDKGSLVVLEDTRVQWEYDGITFRRTIPEGFQFKPGAWALTALVLAALLHPLALWQAAALHDYLYREVEEEPDEALPRVVVDAAMKADEDDPRWLRVGAYWVVRVVGFAPWLGGT